MMKQNTDELKKDKIKGDKLDIDYYENFLTSCEADEYLDALQGYISDQKIDFTKKRSGVLFGDPSLVYKIEWKDSVSERKVLPWNTIPLIEDLKERITSITKQKYTICLMKVYPDGTFGINPHKDREMKPGTMICGVSFGQTRTLEIARFRTKYYIPTGHGSMYVLNHPTNQSHTHAINKDNTTGVRISLTFRNY